MIEKGTLIKSKTKTKDDVFGECLWKVVEVGLPAPEPTRKGKMDGVKCILLGGSGPAAKNRGGFSVIDSVEHIENDIAAGITAIVPRTDADALVAGYAKMGCDANGNALPRHGGTGVVEVDV